MVATFIDEETPIFQNTGLKAQWHAKNQNSWTSHPSEVRLSSLVVEVGCASLSERAGVLWGKGVELLHAILQFSLPFPALLFTKTLGSLRAVTQVRTCHCLFLGGSSSVFSATMVFVVYTHSWHTHSWLE